MSQSGKPTSQQQSSARVGGVDFYTVIRAVAQEVMYQTQAVTWLMADRNKDIVGALSEMDDKKRENWISDSAWPTYAECSMMIEYLEPFISYAENKIAGYLKVKNFRKVDEFKGDLTVLAESYFYWTALQKRSKDVYDQTWRYGIVQPIPDFETAGKEKRPHILTMLSDMAGKMQRGTSKAVKEVEDRRDKNEEPPIGEDYMIPRVPDPRVRPYDTMDRTYHTSDDPESKDEPEDEHKDEPKDEVKENGKSENNDSNKSDT